MEISFQKDTLQKSLMRVQGIVEKRGIYPLLSHVLIAADPEGTFIEATDLEISLKQRVEGEVREGGRLCLPARKFYDVIREMPSGEILLRGEDNFWASIAGERITVRVPGLDPRDFPTFAPVEEEILTVSSDTLKKMIRKVSFCAATQESSMNLHGILMEVKGGQLNLVATDGHRLALCQEEVEGASQQSAILPRKGLLEFRKVFQDDEPIRVTMGEKVVQFSGSRSTLSVRVLEGKFPEYRYVVPKGLENRAIVDREAFLSALRRADIFARERGEGVRIALGDGTMELRAGGGDSGEFAEVLPVTYEGSPLKAMFNPRYLVEALNVMAEEKVVFELRDPESAALLREEGRGDYLYVIMPMRMVE